jgi:hypothetical protein
MSTLISPSFGTYFNALTPEIGQSHCYVVISLRWQDNDNNARNNDSIKYMQNNALISGMSSDTTCPTDQPKFPVNGKTFLLLSVTSQAIGHARISLLQADLIACLLSLALPPTHKPTGLLTERAPQPTFALLRNVFGKELRY